MQGTDLILTTDIIIVFSILVFTILLFISNRLRVDVVGLILIVLLPLTGVIEPKDAISGFGSNAVVAIIAVMIIGAGLDRTGIMHSLTRWIISFSSKSQSKLLALLTAIVGIVSGFMQNIGAIALFLPAATRISKQVYIPISRLLIPMGFCSIMGGCLTLIGSSPLILLNGLMESWTETNSIILKGSNIEPFGLFSVTPFGIALLLICIVYFILLGKYLLPCVDNDACSGFMSSYLDDIYGERVGTIFELTIPDSFNDVTLEELDLRHKYHATVCCISKFGRHRKNFSPIWSDILEPRDTVAVISTPKHIDHLIKDHGWELHKELDVFSEELSPDNAGIHEAIITPHSELAGKTLRQIYFQQKYSINVLALFRDNKVHLRDISNTQLKHGDALLLQGKPLRFLYIKDKLDLVFTEDIHGEIIRSEKAFFAVTSLILAISMTVIFNVSLPIAMMTGALCMILTKVLSIDEAYKSVDWMTIFLLAGLIPLGIAFNKTGGATFLAHSIVGILGSESPFLFMLIVGAITSFFTLFISNVGATVLLVPLAMSMAFNIGVDPRIAALVVGLAASNTFILPTHQVNVLIMRPGGYNAGDYIKAGTGMTVLFVMTVLVILYLFYGVRF